eukprot:11072269-Heterocapsa_arctica.AAC.1
MLGKPNLTARPNKETHWGRAIRAGKLPGMPMIKSRPMLAPRQDTFEERLKKLTSLSWAPKREWHQAQGHKQSHPAHWDAMPDEDGATDDCAPGTDYADDDLFQGEEAIRSKGGPRRSNGSLLTPDRAR